MGMVHDLLTAARLELLTMCVHCMPYIARRRRHECQRWSVCLASQQTREVCIEDEEMGGSSHSWEGTTQVQQSAESRWDDGGKS